MSQAVIVELTPMELQLAQHVGVMRNDEAESAHRASHSPLRGDAGASLHYMGAAAEMAFCKHFGIYFEPTINTFGAADVREVYQIRCRSRHDYDLLIREKDDDTHRFIHATSEKTGIIHFHGWVYGKEGKQAQWKKDHGSRGVPAYFVPTAMLRPLSHLHNLIFQ